MLLVLQILFSINHLFDDSLKYYLSTLVILCNIVAKEKIYDYLSRNLV